MRRVILLIGIGLILLGFAGWILFPDARSDLIERLNFFGGRNGQQTTLVYWGLWESREVVQPLLDQYQSEHPNVTIEYEARNPETHYQTVSSRLGSEGAPDIIRVHASWLPYLQSSLEPIPRNVMTVDEYESTFYPVNSYYLKRNNNYYGIPLMIEGLALVYNQDLFNEAGISAPPNTWVEFRDYAVRLTETNANDEITQSGAALGLADNVDYFADIFALMLAQNGVQFFNTEGKVAIHTSTSQVGSNLGAEALRFYTLFSTSEQSWSESFGNSTREFADGRVAMVLLPSHRIHEVLGRNPQFEVGVAEVPQLPSSSSDSQQLSYANYWVEVVSNDSPNKAEAWEFLKWMSEKEQLTSLYETASDVRTFGEPYPRRDMADALAADAYTKPYVTQGSQYVTSYIAYGTFNQPINQQIIEILGSLIDTAVGLQNETIEDGTIEGALNNAGQQIQQVLDQATLEE